MRVLLLLGALVAGSQAFVVQAPCSGTTECLINCVLDSRCPIFDGITPVLLPGRTCPTFYKCVSGRACEYLCPPGTHYNSREQACDWPQRACCDPTVPCQQDPCGPSGCSPVQPTPPPPPPPPPPSQPCNGITCSINCPLDSRCPAFNPSKPVLLPANVCTSYLKCESGRACPMNCPAGLHFNVNRQICDWPFQACCDPSVECRPNNCDNVNGCLTPAPATVCPPGSFGCNGWMWG